MSNAINSGSTGGEGRGRIASIGPEIGVVQTNTAAGKTPLTTFGVAAAFHLVDEEDFAFSLEGAGGGALLGIDVESGGTQLATAGYVRVGPKATAFFSHSLHGSLGVQGRFFSFAHPQERGSFIDLVLTACAGVTAQRAGMAACFDLGANSFATGDFRYGFNPGGHGNIFFNF